MESVVPFSSSSLVPVVIDHQGSRWPLFKNEGGEPLAKDLDIANWLGFSDPYKIRGLIDRWAADLGRVSATMAETTARGGRPARRYYLTEEQALFVAAKSETPRATDLLKAMIQVFLKARQLTEAIHLRPAVAAPSQNFAALAEFAQMREDVQIAGRVLTILKDDTAQLKAEQDRQKEMLEILEARVCRGQPTQQERDEQARAIWAACECRVSEREKLMLEHIAQQGPATSLVRIGAAARVNSTTARDCVDRMNQRAILDHEQRDPAMVKLRNYYVISDGLLGHSEDCRLTARAALSEMLRTTSADPEPLPGPPSAPTLAVQPIETPTPEVKTERELLVKYIGTYGKLHDYQDEDYHRAYNRIYAHLATIGIECRGKRSQKTGKKLKPLDVLEARGKCDEALKAARQFFPMQAQQNEKAAVH